MPAYENMLSTENYCKVSFKYEFVAKQFTRCRLYYWVDLIWWFIFRQMVSWETRTADDKISGRNSTSFCVLTTWQTLVCSFISKCRRHRYVVFLRTCTQRKITRFTTLSVGMLSRYNQPVPYLESFCEINHPFSDVIRSISNQQILCLPKKLTIWEICDIKFCSEVKILCLLN